MAMHTAVVNILELHSELGLAELKRHCSELGLTVRFYYRRVSDGSASTSAYWQDVILLAEGAQEDIDAFVDSLRACGQAAAAPGDPPCSMRGVWVLVRLWSMPCTELPDAAAEPESAAAPTPRRLGPVSLKASEYADFDELLARRLSRLELGCAWKEVLLTAELNRAISSRPEPSEREPRRKGRAAPSKAGPADDAVAQAGVRLKLLGVSGT